MTAIPAAAPPRHTPVDHRAARVRLALLSLGYRALGVAAIAVMTVRVDVEPGLEVAEVVWGLGTLALLVAVADAVARLLRLVRGAQVPCAPAGRLPPGGSRVHDIARRLAAGEAELAAAAPALGRSADIDWPGVGQSSAVLHRLVDGICALEGDLERARVTGRPEVAAELEASVHRLAWRLSEGVSAHERLVRAATVAVLGGRPDAAGSPRRVRASAEALVGITRGMATRR